MNPPLFEVTSAELSVADRRLTTAAKVQAVLFGGTATDTALIESLIDRVSADCARYCGLACDIAGKKPTFGGETLRATWYATSKRRPSKLVLPWRVPITAITSVVEDGVTLDTGSDLRRMQGGMLERLRGDAPCCWSAGKIVVVYAAGWTVATADAVPADLEAAVIEQVKLKYLGRDRDPSLRSETINEVHQADYSVGGGNALGASGLLVQVEGALADYKDWSAG